MNLSRLKGLAATIKDPQLSSRINSLLDKKDVSSLPDLKSKQRKIGSKLVACPECGSSTISELEGITCIECGCVVKANPILSAEENSVNFSKVSNRSSDYMKYNGLGSSYNLQSCISGGTKSKSKQYNNTYVIQKNYQEETRLKNVKYIKGVMQKLPYIPRSVVDSAIKKYIKFKMDGNTNRAEINKGIMAAFIKKSAFDYGMEITNKQIAEIFEINIKHVTKGIQIIIDSGIKINYDLNALTINYIKRHFTILNLSTKHINKAIFLTLFINRYMNKITSSFIPHSIAAWVTFYIIVYYEIPIGIDISIYRGKMNLYASKVKALFDNNQASVMDEPGKKREHIVSNVNITKVDRIIEPFKPKINSILNSLDEEKDFTSIPLYG